MKVLVRKPADDTFKWEVFEQSRWLRWMNPETGAPLSDPNGGYSSPVEIPDEYIGLVKADDFDVTYENVKTTDEVTGEETEQEIITAVFQELRFLERVKDMPIDEYGMM